MAQEAGLCREESKNREGEGALTYRDFLGKITIIFDQSF